MSRDGTIGYATVTLDSRGRDVPADDVHRVVATAQRAVILPAVMRLFGPAAWWLPSWLERRLPRLALEHAGLPVQAAGHASGSPESAAVGVPGGSGDAPRTRP